MIFDLIILSALAPQRLNSSSLRITRPRTALATSGAALERKAAKREEQGGEEEGTKSWNPSVIMAMRRREV